MMGEGLLPLAGRRVLVSGGTTGIGRGTVEQLAAAGARVVTFSHNEATIAEARAALPEVTFEIGDIASPDDVRRVVARAQEVLGGLDAVVNNAGGVAKSLTTETFEDWSRNIQVNLIGAMQLAQEALPHLREAGGGHIVNVGSMSSKTRDAGMDVYVATKCGLQGWSDSFGRVVAKDRIAVVLVEPGLTLTELSRGEEERDRQMLEEARKMLPADIARVILFALQQPLNLCMPLVQLRPRMQTI